MAFHSSLEANFIHYNLYKRYIFVAQVLNDAFQITVIHCIHQQALLLNKMEIRKKRSAQLISLLSEAHYTN